MVDVFEFTPKGISINKERFKEWLESFDSGAIVGHVKAHRSCPLYTFLTDNGCPIKCVAFNYVRENDEYGSTYLLERWAEDFVYLIDHHQDESRMYEPITKERALQVLSEIPA